MKKIYTILFLCVILILSTEVKAQIVKGEAFMGLNLTQIDGDKAYGYNHLGFHGGLGALVPIYQKDYFNIDFSVEILFNHKGAHQGRIYADTLNNGDIITGEYDVNMNYLEVPLIIYFSDKQISSLGIGVSYGRLVGLREYEHGKLTDVNINYTGNDRYKLDEWCFLADLKFRLYERLKLGIRYQYSIAPIRTRDFNLVNGQPDLKWQDVAQYNNVITARLIYVFNEDRSQYIYDEYHFTGDNPKIHQKMIDKQIKKLKKKQAKDERKAGKR